MSRKSPAHRHTKIEGAPKEIVQPTRETRANSGFASLLESASQQILAVTYWFEPVPNNESYPVTIRFTGHRLNVKGRVQSGDRFTQDETIEQVIPGSGPVSLTARVRGINPGEWAVTAHILESTRPARESRDRENAPLVAASGGPIVRFWRRWAPSAEEHQHLSTCPAPLAHVAGILPGIWGIMVTLGMIIAVVLQAVMIAARHLIIGPWLAVTLAAIAVGIAGAKVWYIVLHRGERLYNGWCIQGFITGATLTAAILLPVFRMSAGVFLDTAVPGLLIAMAVGRVGCFFAGCCGGPPTAARWGVWSSDQHVGARRVPTQLMEMALALSLGIATLVVFLARGPANGAIFVAGIAAYVLGRQGILSLRAERRKTRLGGPIMAVLAALVLIAAIVVLLR